MVLGEFQCDAASREVTNLFRGLSGFAPVWALSFWMFLQLLHETQTAMNELNNVLAFAQSGHESDGSGATIVCLAISLLGLVGMAQTFAKAGLPRWGVLIPIYNVVLLLQMAQRPSWWLLLLLIPGVNVIVAIVIAVEIARVFGKGTGFGWGLAFLGFLFFPILGFGDAVYLPTAAVDPTNSSEARRFFPRISAASKHRFKELGVALANDFQGRGYTVGIGRGSAITGSDLSELIPLGFHELYFSRTGLGDEAIDSLAAMTQLRVVDLSNTKVSRDGISRLKAALPNTEVIG